MGTLNTWSVRLPEFKGNRTYTHLSGRGDGTFYLLEVVHASSSTFQWSAF